MRYTRQFWVFVALLMSGLSITVSNIGQVYISEFILLLVLPLIFPRLLSSLSIEDKKVAKVFLISALATAISGAINSVEAQILLKGTLFLTTLLGVYLVLGFTSRRDPKILLTYFLCYQFGQLIGLWIQPNSLFQGDPWKFGYAYPLTGVFLFLVNKFFKKRTLVFLALLSLSTVHLFMGTRNLALICFAASFLVVYLGTAKKKSLSSYLRVLVVTSLTVILGFNIYANLASSGNLGESAFRKYVSQNNSGGSIIFNSRPELNIALSVLRDNPIVGLGPFPILSDSKIEDVRSDIGFNQKVITLDYLLMSTRGIIPSHSAALQFWLWGGILALALPVFWVAVAVKSIHFSDGKPLGVFLSLLFIWDTLFSPFGANKRLASAIILLILTVSIARVKDSAETK